MFPLAVGWEERQEIRRKLVDQKKMTCTKTLKPFCYRTKFILLMLTFSFCDDKNFEVICFRKTFLLNQGKEFFRWLLIFQEFSAIKKSELIWKLCCFLQLLVATECLSFPWSIREKQCMGRRTSIDWYSASIN